MLVVGIVLFASAIMASIALHEYGHFAVARRTGMTVRRFFVGFGPTVFSWRRGGVEYGVKGIPLGGFVDIAGMTALDPLTEDEKPNAMYRKPARSRIAVLLAGPAMNFVLTLAIFFGIAIVWGLPNLDREPVPTTEYPAVIAATSCVDGGTACADGGPAAVAGIEPGDRITEIAGEPVASWADVSRLVTDRPGDTLPVVVERGGQEVPLEATIADAGDRGALGVRVDVEAVPDSVLHDPRYRLNDEYSVAEAVPGTLVFSGEMLRLTGEAIIALPGKIPGVVESIFGAPRADDSPVSVVGASHIGGQAVERENWQVFFLLLGGLNLFLGAFNLIPLTPFDGGHIAVVLYERFRDFLRKLRGLAPGGPVNYERLTPITLAVFSVLVAVSVIVITADIVNPILL